MKKIIALILALLVLTLCACGKDENPGGNITEPIQTTPATEPATEPEPTQPATEHFHEYEIVQVEPTCTEDGSITHTCACGDSYSDAIPSYGHNFGAVSVKVRPTMISGGSGVQTCFNCKTEVVVELPKNTLEQEVQSFLNDYLLGLPNFKSTKDLSGGMVFNWATWHIPQVSWNMDENYLITIVYSVDEMDAFTQKYLEKVFDYAYLAEANKDFMTIDMEKREITIITGGAGGGGFERSIEKLTEHDDGSYTLRYKCVDPYAGDPTAPGSYYYGNIDFKIVDGHMVLLSHNEERN